MDELKLFWPELNDYIIFAEALKSRAKSLHSIQGIDKLSRKINAELKFLVSLNKQRGRVVASQLKSSNLSHFASLLHAAERLPGVVQVLQPFFLPSRHDNLVVDIVAENGHIWVKVIARKAQALHLVWAGKGQFGERDLISVAEDYLDCVKRHPHEFKIPQIVFAFYNQVTEAISEALENKGIIVLGERVPVNDDVQVKLESVLFSELEDDCQVLKTNDEQHYDIQSHDTVYAQKHGIGSQGVKFSHKDEIISRDGVNFHDGTQNLKSSFSGNECLNNDSNQLMSEIIAEMPATGDHPYSAARHDILETATLQSDDQMLGNQVIQSYPDSLSKSAQIILDHHTPLLRHRSSNISVHLENLNSGPCERETLSPLSTETLCAAHSLQNYHNIFELKSPNEGSCVTPGPLGIDMSSDTSNPPSVPWDKDILCPSLEIPDARQLHDLFTDKLRQDLFLQLVVSPPVFSSLPVGTSGSHSNKTGPHVGRVNLDITTLIALVSSVTNGKCHLIFRDKVLTQQASEERNVPILPVLDEFLQGKELFVCETAVSSFKSILDILGGAQEKERARELLARVHVVKDQPSERSMGLECQGRVKERSKVVFGTGDTLQAVTITSNMGFVRAAKGQGVNFAVFLHTARALTEEKEKYASPL